MSWANFFVAEVGAAAALSGLLFVAVSINLARILAIEHLPERAGETLIVLLAVVAVATFGLVPGQSRAELGYEVAGTGAIVWIATVRTQLRAFRDAAARQWLPARVIGTQVSAIPFIVGGVLIIMGNETGMYWLVPGTLASFASAMLNAWVLLVEIQR